MASKVPASSTWTRATPDRESRGIIHPDTRLIAEFQGEFEIVAKQDVAGVPIRECTRDNLEYIKSALPMKHIGMADFFQDLVKHKWQRIKPNVAKGAAPAFLNMRGPKGVMGFPIGARRDMTGDQIADSSRPAFPGGMADDWAGMLQLDRVNAYVFRGDKRDPRAIKLANGFNPPNTRKDNAYVGVIARKFSEYMGRRFGKKVDPAEIESYIRGKGQQGGIFTEYEIWREILRGEEMHVGKMTVDEFMKGYISTSRSAKIAAGFAQSSSADGRRDSLVSVYALHSEGGFLLPQMGKSSHARRNEAEIAHPGPLPWDKVVGFRSHLVTSPDDPRTWQKKSAIVMVRSSFRMADPQGAYEVAMHLSSVL